jgi:hypothetical protein
MKKAATNQRALRPSWMYVFLGLASLSVGCWGFSGRYVFPSSRVQERSFLNQWPDAGAVLAEDVATLEYTYRSLPGVKGKHLVAVLDHRRKYHIASEEGLKLASIALPMDGYSSVVSLAVRVSDPGHEGKWRHIHQRVREEVQVSSPRVSVLRMDVPGLKKGGWLEYRYERVYSQPHRVPVWVFGDVFPTQQAQFHVRAHPHVQLDVREGQGEQHSHKAAFVPVSENGYTQTSFFEKDVPPLYPEPHMPHPAHVSRWVAVTVQAAPLLENTPVRPRLQTWEDVAAQAVVLVQAVGAEKQNDTLENIYHHVRDHVSFLTGVAFTPPVKASHIAQGKPACARDVAAYLAGALGWDEASMVWVSSPQAPVLVEDLPGFYGFDTVLVRVERDGKDLFLDPSCASCEPGEVSAALRGARAWLVDSKGHARWATLPAKASLSSSDALEVQWSGYMDAQGVLQGVFTGTVGGVLARAWKEAKAHGHADSHMAEQLWGARSGISVKPGASVEWADAQNPVVFQAETSFQTEANPLSRGFVLKASDWVGVSFSEAHRSVRRYPYVSSEGPYTRSYHAAVVLPEGFKAQNLPPPVRMENAYITWKATWLQEGRHLSYTRTVDVRWDQVPASQWPQVYSFLQEIYALENHVVEVLPKP